jgi:uncharacterized protein (TIGR02186 family)
MKSAALVLLLLAAPALAGENLTSGLSQDVVAITSNYSGTDITVFGAIEGAPGAEAGDIVVVVRGPEAAMTVRRKDRIAGVWINRARARLMLPGYYFIAANRPLQEIAAADTLGRYELGLSHLRAETLASDGNPAPYVAALVRAQSRGGLYAEKNAGVEMLSATLFRVRVPVPATVPRGSYSVEAYLFRDGNVISVQSTPLFVDQTGFERRLFDFAHAKPLLYGLGTVLMAVLLGWLSTFFFRKRA